MALQFAQAVYRLELPRPDLFICTCNSLMAEPKAAPQSALAAASHGGVWGFARCLRLEAPAQRVLTCDVASWCEAKGLMEDVQSVASGHSEVGCEVEIYLTNTKRYVGRLRRHGCTSTRDSASLGGQWGITGGLGGLGLRGATLLSLSGAGRIVLSTRSGHIAHYGQSLMERWTALGSLAVVQVCDIGESRQVEALGDACRQLRGLLHTAGMLNDGILL